MKHPLRNLRVVEKCPASWQEMTGGDQVRYCGQCKQNVYNLLEMTEDEALSLLAASEGKLCVRFYQRRDGTVVTSDCSRVVRTAARTKGVVATVFSCLGLGALATFLFPVMGGPAPPAETMVASYSKRVRQIDRELETVKDPEEKRVLLAMRSGYLKNLVDLRERLQRESAD
jgi:hypothetical protein